MVHGRLVGRLMAPVVLLLLVLASVTTVSAQGTVTPAPNSQFSGRVTNTNPLTVNSNGQDRRVNPGPNAAILREGRTVAAGDLRVGDQVNVTANPDGTASRIETTQVAPAEGLPAWLIPLLLGLLLLGLLLYFLSRRGKKDNFVLERNNSTTGTTGTGTGTTGTTGTGRS